MGSPVDRRRGDLRRRADHALDVRTPSADGMFVHAQKGEDFWPGRPILEKGKPMPDAPDLAVVKAKAAKLFLGTDNIRRAVQKVVNCACANAKVPVEDLATMVGLPNPKDVTRALNGSPELLTERIALRLMAPLGISLDEVLPDLCMQNEDFNEWNQLRIAMRNGRIATTGSTNDDIEVNAKLFIRLQAISSLD